MFARNLGLSCLFLLKITIFLKQTFFKDSKKIKLNHQKVWVPSTGTAVLFKNSTGTDGTFLSKYRYRYRGAFRKYRVHLWLVIMK